MRTTMKLLGAAAVAAVIAAPLQGANAADKIKLTMNWLADSAHLGFAVAQKNGFYAEEGLEVELEEGRGSSVAAQLVATGQAELGYADAGAILNVASQGAPLKIIATIWKAGQFGLVYLDSAGIDSPQDLVGKKIGVAPGSAQEPLMEVFLKANQISESDVDIISTNQNTFLGLLTNGDLDAVAETPENILLPLTKEGLGADNMYFYDNGVPLISLSLVAREDKLAADPDLYRRFVRASLRGWREAMNDPAASVDALAEVFPEMQHAKDSLLEAAQFSFSSVCPVAGQIGVTPPATWERVYEVMTSAMDFSQNQPITAYYSEDFLPADAPACP